MKCLKITEKITQFSMKPIDVFSEYNTDRLNRYVQVNHRSSPGYANLMGS